ncbi:MAG TPA: sulfite exporter TauE/SafE family protein [Methylibium sp.]|nr:sulfite exporter TauE/SafE family protein [Methylibium sp.]
MSSALVAAAALMGLAGTPHCAAMCGAPCAALARRCGNGRPRQALAVHQAGRLLSYAVAGALVAASTGLLADGARAAAWLRPVWLLLPLAALLLGLWLLVAGRPLRWMGADQLPPAGLAVVHGPTPGGRAAGLAQAAGAGLLWAAWPCGLLYSALLVAALADTPWGGAAVMSGFALASLPGVVAGPLLWQALARRVAAPRLALRGAGALLVAASGWGLWLQFTVPGGLWCAPA